jgi:hypothetical protein
MKEFTSVPSFQCTKGFTSTKLYKHATGSSFHYLPYIDYVSFGIHSSGTWRWVSRYRNPTFRRNIPPSYSKIVMFSRTQWPLKDKRRMLPRNVGIRLPIYPASQTRTTESAATALRKISNVVTHNWVPSTGQLDSLHFYRQIFYTPHIIVETHSLK